MDHEKSAPVQPILVEGQEVLIRNYSHQTDSADVVAVLQASGLYEPNRDDPNVLHDASRTCRDSIVVAELGGKAIGVVHVDILGDHPILSGLSVREEVRRRGIGAALVEAGVSRLAKHGKGYAEIIIDAERDDLAALYASMGFKPAGVYRGLERRILQTSPQPSGYPVGKGEIQRRYDATDIAELNTLTLPAFESIMRNMRAGPSPFWLPTMHVNEALTQTGSAELSELRLGGTKGRAYAHYGNAFTPSKDAISVWLQIETGQPERFNVLHRVPFLREDASTGARLDTFGTYVIHDKQEAKLVPFFFNALPSEGSVTRLEKYHEIKLYHELKSYAETLWHFPVANWPSIAVREGISAVWGDSR